jgi:nucleoside-diphosphate-sugar epimerase
MQHRGSVPPGTVLVTGATGFIGRHACQHLSERGWTVRALVRSPPSIPVPGASSYAFGDLADRAAVRDAARGVTALLHLAGLAHRIRDKPDENELEYRRVNVDGTRTVVEEAAAAGCRRIAFMSSIAAGAGSSGSIGKTRSLTATAYGRTKLEAEGIVHDIAQRAGVNATIIRPTLVYGPGMKGNPLRLFQLVSTGLPLPFGLLRGKKSFLYVGNLVAAIGELLASADSVRIVVAADPQAVSTAEFSRAIARALGTRSLLLPVPEPALRAIGRIGDMFSFLPLNTESVERLAGELVVDHSVMLAVLGGRYPYSMTEGLARTAAWFQSR